MITYYSNLAKKYNNQLIGRYRNAIYLIIDEDTSFSSMDKNLATEPFLLVSEPHKKHVKGYPLDSLSIDINTGKYYYDMEGQAVDQSAIDQGFQEFFKGVLIKIK